jgi:hypothetical protein
MRSLVEDINMRVIRLASVLDLKLQNEADVQRVLARRTVTVAVATERRTNADPEKSRIWEELRALLVLRYELETRYVDQVGVGATRQILIDAEEHIIDKGFKFGDDGIGIDLNSLFKPS